MVVSGVYFSDLLRNSARQAVSAGEVVQTGGVGRSETVELSPVVAAEDQWELAYHAPMVVLQVLDERPWAFEVC